MSTKSRVYPLYIALDNSASMRAEIEGVSYSSLAREIPYALLEMYEKNTALVSSLRVSVITFNNVAKTVLPLSTIPKLNTLPSSFDPGYRTFFGKLFEELAQKIREDFGSLSKNHIVMKPAVLIVTDGIPSDTPTERELAFEKLGLRIGGVEIASDFPAPPQVIIFGIGEADMGKIVAYDTTGSAANQNIRRASNFREVSEHLKAIAIWVQTHVSSSLANPNMDPSKPWIDPNEDDYEAIW